MDSPHTIRLRGPWQRRVVSAEGPKDVVTVQMPSGWDSDLGREFAGTVEYSRFFNRATGIDHQTPITLVLHGIVGHARVTLNGIALGVARWPNHPHRFDVTGKLEPRNQLTLRVTAISREERGQRNPAGSCPDEAGLVGEVHLELD